MATSKHTGARPLPHLNRSRQATAEVFMGRGQTLYAGDVDDASKGAVRALQLQHATVSGADAVNNALVFDVCSGWDGLVVHGGSYVWSRM
ncbi:hypothetical protein BA022_04825 [Diaphorobacter nitroreducens]|nr:hypothetical protein BA022_04825 [Diaphorobacter nitroreducens]